MAKKLIIKSSAFQKQAMSLLDALSNNPKFGEDFIKNPFLHISKHMSMVDIKSYSKTQIAEVNNFLFQLLSNTAFISWLKKYQKENIINLKAEALEEQTELRNIIMKDIAGAMLKYGNFGDLEKMFRIPTGSATAAYNPVYDEIFVVIKGVVLLLVVVTQIDVTPLMLKDRIEVSQMVNVAQLRKVSATVLKYAKENYGNR
jgi:hypothetical protein